MDPAEFHHVILGIIREAIPCPFTHQRAAVTPGAIAKPPGRHKERRPAPPMTPAADSTPDQLNESDHPPGGHWRPRPTRHKTARRKAA